MNPRRRIVGALALLSSLVLSTCTGSETAGPGGLPDASPSAVILDGANGGNEFFYFLPPIVPNPNPQGTFNALLSPSVEICELDDGTGSCVAGPPLRTFSSPDVAVSDGKYQLNWDTSDTPLSEDLNYRATVSLGELDLGLLDLNPQNPNGQTPGEVVEGFYTFRNGETIPFKFWIGQGVLCNSNDQLVIECAEASYSPDANLTLSIDQLGNELGVFLQEGASGNEFTIIVERIDQAELDLLGEDCIGGLDAPLYGDCFRIRTEPELTTALVIPAEVSICVNLTDAEFAQLQSPEQVDRIQTYRFGDDGTIQVLANTSSTICDTPVGLLDVPDNGLMRYAALSVNALGRLLGPEPVGASDLGLGSLTEFFSRFSWGLPTRIDVFEGNDQVAPAGSNVPVPPAVIATDAGGEPVEGATVHFVVTGGDGSVSDESVVTGPDGTAAPTSWTLGPETVDMGANTLDAWGLGLISPGEAFSDHTTIAPTDVGTVPFTATAIGAPANVNPADGDGQTGEVGQPLSQPLVVSVTDQNTNPVAGADVTWGPGIVGDPQTDADGFAQGTWTLPTTTTPTGTVMTTATVNGISANFTATAEPGAATTLELDGDGQSGLVGSTLDPISVTVKDTYGNVRENDDVDWTVMVGGGTVTPTMNSTDENGSASTTWTLGLAPGSNAVLAEVEGLSHTFTATASCLDGFGTANVNGQWEAGEWTCAESFTFTANLSGGGTPAEVFWMNDGANLYMAVRVLQDEFARRNSLRIDFDNGNGIHDAGDDAIGYDADGGVFVDEYLTAKCANNSQSGCGASDGQVDGVGAALNDGTWTTYELSHPLTSGDSNDFALTAGNSIVGFFGTLRVGNGAQGNTQFLGFRDFTLINIVAP